MVIDSVAALLPQEEADKDMTENSMALRARLLSKFTSGLGQVVSDTFLPGFDRLSRSREPSRVAMLRKSCSRR